MAGSMMTGDGYGSHHRRQREDSCGWDSVFSSHPPRGRVPSVGKTSLSLRPPSMSQDARAAALSGGDSPTNRHCVSSLTVCSEESEVSVELLAQLMAEKKRLECVGHVPLATRMLDDEISRVRAALFHSEFVVDDLQLPEPQGEVVCVTEKVYVPIKEYPEYNFVGRILGPRGMTAKQLEQETGCKIMVRGRGSMRDRRRDDYGRGGVRSQWEHLDDDLHVLIQCEDTENRAVIKMRAAMEQVKRLLIPAPEGTDELKRKQLMELAIINGTYRPFHGRRDGPHSPPHTVLPSTPRLMTPMPMSPFRPPVFVHPSHSPMLSPPRMAYPHPPPQSPVAVQQMPPVPFDYNTLLSCFSNLGGFTPSLIEALKDINMNHVVKEQSCFFGGARSSTPPSSPSI